jgi:hypothetical protein
MDISVLLSPQQPEECKPANVTETTETPVSGDGGNQSRIVEYQTPIVTDPAMPLKSSEIDHLKPTVGYPHNDQTDSSFYLHYEQDHVLATHQQLNHQIAETPLGYPMFQIEAPAIYQSSSATQYITHELSANPIPNFGESAQDFIPAEIQYSQPATVHPSSDLLSTSIHKYNPSSAHVEYREYTDSLYTGYQEVRMETEARMNQHQTVFQSQRSMDQPPFISKENETMATQFTTEDTSTAVDVRSSDQPPGLENDVRAQKRQVDVVNEDQKYGSMNLPVPLPSWIGAPRRSQVIPGISISIYGYRNNSSYTYI